MTTSILLTPLLNIPWYIALTVVAKKARLFNSSTSCEYRYGNRYRFFVRLVKQENESIMAEQGLIDFAFWHIDSTTVRAHKSAAGAGVKRGIKRKKMSRQVMH
jgi:hypothetical protein